MNKERRHRVVVQEGGVITLRVPDLSPGIVAEVVILPETEPQPTRTLSSIIGTGKGRFGTAEEIDAFIRRERDAWDY